MNKIRQARLGVIFGIALANNIIVVAASYFIFDYIFFKNVPLQEKVVEFNNKRESTYAGNYQPRGSIILRDSADENADGFQGRAISPLEIGFYRWGTGFFTDDRIEFWTGKSVSFASRMKTPNIEIRQLEDKAAGFWANGEGEVGTGLEELKLYVGGWNGDRADYRPEHASAGARRKPTDLPDFQFVFEKNGNLIISGDLISNGVNLTKALRK